MEIFAEYTHMIETLLEQRLAQQFPHISIKNVASILVERSDEVTVDVIEMLSSLSDFNEFKELMLSHKRIDCPIVTMSTICSRTYRYFNQTSTNR
mmetsp:Transcript_45788/g.139098  ORF Transcript_45788/g.139098 Transcript_45788/m.139098 type:complete len:95 (+) Transcript_45788:481-765(+)